MGCNVHALYSYMFLFLNTNYLVSFLSLKNRQRCQMAKNELRKNQDQPFLYFFFIILVCNIYIALKANPNVI